MKTSDLFLRCYAKKQDGLWVAVCIDLSLAAQSADPLDAINKLNAQITDYVREAFSEPEYTEQLLTQRKAPLSLVFKYYACAAKVRACRLILRAASAVQSRTSCSPDEKADVKVFRGSLPMAPAV